MTLVLLEVYRNIVTRPTWTAARAKDTGTEKFAATNHTPSLFSIKEAWGWEGDARGRRDWNICICTADSLCCKAETDTPL